MALGLIPIALYSEWQDLNFQDQKLQNPQSSNARPLSAQPRTFLALEKELCPFSIRQGLRECRGSAQLHRQRSVLSDLFKKESQASVHSGFLVQDLCLARHMKNVFAPVTIRKRQVN